MKKKYKVLAPGLRIMMVVIDFITLFTVIYSFCLLFKFDMTFKKGIYVFFATVFTNFLIELFFETTLTKYIFGTKVRGIWGENVNFTKRFQHLLIKNIYIIVIFGMTAFVGSFILFAGLGFLIFALVFIFNAAIFLGFVFGDLFSSFGDIEDTLNASGVASVKEIKISEINKQNTTENKTRFAKIKKAISENITFIFQKRYDKFQKEISENKFALYYFAYKRAINKKRNFYLNYTDARNAFKKNYYKNAVDSAWIALDNLPTNNSNNWFYKFKQRSLEKKKFLLYHIIANSEFSLNNYRQALKAFREEKRIGSKDEMILYKMGKSSFEIQNYDDSILFLSNSNIVGDAIEITKMLAYSYVKKKKFFLAKQHLVEYSTHLLDDALLDFMSKNMRHTILNYKTEEIALCDKYIKNETSQNPFFINIDWNLEEIITYDYYYPYHKGNNSRFNDYSSIILDLKNQRASAIEYFLICLTAFFKKDFTIVIIPSHSEFTSSSGIKLLAEKLIEKNNFKNGLDCLIRKKSIHKLSAGGNRSTQVHLDSMYVQNIDLIFGKNILLFDDISTSGNSLRAGKKLLETAGARNVQMFALGQTFSYR